MSESISVEILKALIIGAAASLTATAILGLRNWCIRYRDRRDQIPYIGDLIASQMDRILSATDLHDL